ncbi:MAG: outer membrane protein assembly factor BamD [Hyphomicrobiaceae bacterium]
MAHLTTKWTAVWRMASRWLAAASTAAVVGSVLAACSSSLDLSKQALNPDPPGKMYALADSYLNKGAYSEAARRFENLDRDHPYAPEARRAMVMAAYAYYKAGKFPEAIAAANRYTVLHPGTKDAALAHHIIASANFDDIRDPHRDQTATRKARAELKLLVQRYPDSPYTKQAVNRIRIAENLLAANEMEVGRWHLKRKLFAGAIGRFKTVVTDYQTTPQVEEALYRIVEANMALGVTPEAQAAGAVLGHNFPNSAWYKRAYGLLKSGGVSPSMGGDSWFTKALKSLGPGSKSDEPKVQPKAPGPGQPAPEDMPAPKGGVPTAGNPSGRPPLGFKG